MNRSSQPSRMNRAAQIGMVVVVTLVAYANTLRAPFIFDDIHGIVHNPTLSSFWAALRPPTKEALSGRPVANLSFAINRAVSGDAVWSYHGLNVLIHVAASLTAFALLRRVFRRWFVPNGESRSAAMALAIAALWALHPLQTESVTYIVQRVESLMSLWYLATLYTFVRALDSERPAPWLGASCVACALGMATKEVMISAPLIVLLFDRTFVSGTFRAALTARRGYYAALGSTWVLLAICVAQAGGRVAAAGAIATPSPWEYLVTQAVAIPHYVRLVVWPADQVFDYGYGLTPFSLGAALGLVVLAAALGASAWAVLAFRSRLGFAGIWFFAVLAPSSSVVPLTQQTVAEHRMYLVLVVPIGVLVWSAFSKLGRHAIPLSATAALAVAALTVHRNRLYSTPLELWRDTAAKAPQNARAWAYLAHRLADDRRWQEAIRASETQLRVDPRYTVDADAIIGRSLLELGRAEEALPHLERAVAMTPDAFDAHTNLGMGLAAIGRVDQAVREYQAALALNPDAADAHGNLANALIKLGRATEAWPHYEKAATIQPLDPQTQLNWAASLGEVGDFDGAIEHFNRAVVLDAKSAAAHLGLAMALGERGRMTEARRECEEALRLDPNLEGAREVLRRLEARQ